MKICFLARPAYDKVSTSIFNYLKESIDQNVAGIFITTTKQETEYVKSNVKNAEIYETDEFIKKNWNSFTLDKLAYFEEKYDCRPIWSYIYTDRFLIECDYDYAVKITVGLFAFFESIFQNKKIDFYYSETIATLQCYIAYLVGKKYGVVYVSQMSARGLDSTHHYFLCDPFQNIMNFNKKWADEIYSDEEIKRADDFLSTFETRNIRPSYMIKNGAVPRLKLKYLALPFLRIWNKFSDKYNNPYSYIYYKQYKTITNPIKFFFRYQKAKKYYHKADFSKKYVYFPLHFQPEASTIVCAAKYEKQLFFIDSWAKSLPADTLLYVKEHYAILGHRDLNFYNELKKYPNVVLIDPYEDPRKMIENAFAVTTLTGTAGWEAMLLRKPVFIGGNIFFDCAPGVIKVDDIYQNYIDNICKWKKPERNEIIKYLCAYFRTLKLGYVNGIWKKPSDVDNIINVSKSLYEQLKLIK